MCGQDQEEEGGTPPQQHAQPARGQEGRGTSSRPRATSARSLMTAEGGDYPERQRALPAHVMPARERGGGTKEVKYRATPEQRALP